MSTTPAGVGFVAHIKGRKTHDIVDAGPVDPREPDAPRRHRRRSAAGRRRRHPDADPRRILPSRPAASSASRCRRSASTASAWSSCRRNPRRGWPASRRSSARSRRRDRCCSAGATCRRDNSGLGHADQGGRAGHPPGVRRPRVARHGPGRVRAQALRDPQGRGPRDPGSRPAGTARSSTCRRCRRARSSTRACCSPTRSASTTSTCTTGRMVSALAMVHQRFSTNTFPTWDLAHPFRFDRPQRRDQHAARQLQLDPRARRSDRRRRCSATICRSSGR